MTMSQELRVAAASSLCHSIGRSQFDNDPLARGQVGNLEMELLQLATSMETVDCREERGGGFGSSHYEWDEL